MKTLHQRPCVQCVTNGATVPRVQAKTAGRQQRRDIRVNAGSTSVSPSRREWLLGLAAVPLVGTKPAQAGLLDLFQGQKGVDYAAVREDIVKVIKAEPDKGPTLVRLAWHSSGTYDRMTKTGGSGKGTIRFTQELSHGANAGLNLAVDWMEPIHAKYAAQGLSYADLYTLGGVAAVAALGGPEIPWRSGRVDAMDPVEVTPDGRLPAADNGSPGATADALRKTFSRMGFNDQEIVALAGAHTLGRGHAEASGYVGPWTPTPTSFSNLYFVLLQNLTWEGETLESGVYQYTDSPTKKLMMLPADLVMIEDPNFKKYVELYAKDQDQFFTDFSAAFQKLEELGCSDLEDVSFA